MKEETVVVIIGAGPAGLATSACLNLLRIKNIVLEKEDCSGSLWKKRSYERLKLHIPKEFCQLPHMGFPLNTPTYVSKDSFIKYLDNYSSNFDIRPVYNQAVESAWFDREALKWRVVARNVLSGNVEEYLGGFVVVATGENSEGFVPGIDGLGEFKGEVMHSSEYDNGERFRDKDVLVVGCGNSGMEIAYDLSNFGAQASIVVRSSVHVLTKEMVHLGMYLLKFLPCSLVDNIMMMISKFKHGDLSKYGLPKPTKGPFNLKRATGRSPVIDVGAVHKIKTGSIQVLPSVSKVEGAGIEFANGKMNRFDAIVFATGYKSTVRKWLKEDEGLFNEDGMPKRRGPNNWKGENGLYCAGFSSAGLFGISSDAQNIADDINKIITQWENRSEIVDLFNTDF